MPAPTKKRWTLSWGPSSCNPPTKTRGAWVSGYPQILSSTGILDSGRFGIFLSMLWANSNYIPVYELGLVVVFPQDSWLHIGPRQESCGLEFPESLSIR